MARPKRINLPHALYHVMSRTNSGDVCFIDGQDRFEFFKYLAKYRALLEFKVHAYCLMPNHFHLLLESGPNPALSEFMRRLLTAYTISFNRRRGRHGHLFQGRFKSFFVDKAGYMLAVARYIHLNPSEFRGMRYAEKYPGSSLLHYLKGREPAFLDTGEILSWFKGDREAYGRFVREGLSENVKPKVLEQRFIGGEKFARRVKKRLKSLKQSGARADQAKRRASLAVEEKKARTAEKILEETARYFRVVPSMAASGGGGSRAAGRAKSAMVALLRDHVPWTYDQIARFAGLKNRNSVHYHLRKMCEDEAVAEAVKAVKKELML